MKASMSMVSALCIVGLGIFMWVEWHEDIGNLDSEDPHLVYDLRILNVSGTTPNYVELVDGTKVIAVGILPSDIGATHVGLDDPLSGNSMHVEARALIIDDDGNEHLGEKWMVPVAPLKEPYGGKVVLVTIRSRDVADIEVWRDIRFQ